MLWTLRKPELTGMWWFSETPWDHAAAMVFVGLDDEGEFTVRDIVDGEVRNYKEMTGWWSDQPIDTPIDYEKGSEPKENN